MMKTLMILLTIVGGAGPVVASEDDGSKGTISGKGETSEATKSPFDSKTQLHFRPDNGIFGGPMPYFWKGEYHVFYLGRGGRRHIVSQNLVNWKELPIALPIGAPGEPDSSSCNAGSIIERNGTFHIFYLGRNKKDGKTIGTVCHSTSQDLIHWKKDPTNPIITPDYEKYVFGATKDPYVFWNEQDQRYWMLIADRLREAPTSRKGVLAMAVSPNLEHWERRDEPFWAPDTSTSEFEVPDLFQWNGRWYLTFSTYVEGTRSRYRVADHVTGPWLAPAIDNFDDHACYAFKTGSDGKRRFAFGGIPVGWKPARADGTEKVPSGIKEALSIREVTQQPDGSLAFQCPQEILRACGPTIPAKLQTRLGT